MLKPNEIEALPKQLEELYSNLEMRIMKDIVRRIRINSDITRSADWQINRMRQLGESKQYIKSMIQEDLKLTDNEINYIYDKVIASGYARNKKLYKETGKEFIPYNQNKELQTLISSIKAQTLGNFNNFTQSLGFVTMKNGKRAFNDIEKYYIKTLDGALLDITSGAFDYNTVIKRVINEMTNSGLRTVDYASGYTRRIETAVRSSLMTGVNQVTSKITEQTAKQLDTEYFEVSYHGGARPSHQEWQGKVYKKDELVSICGLGTVIGLCGANCMHDYDPFIPGVSERNYTDEQLEEMNKIENTPITYKGQEYTQYEARQQQRYLETSMRKQRQDIQLLKEGNANEEDIIIAKAKYRTTMSEYVRFSDKMGLPQELDRIKVDGIKGIGGAKELKAIEKRANLYYNGSVDEYIKYDAGLRKHYDLAISKGDLTPLVDYDTYRIVDSNIRKELVGLKTTNNIEIKSYSKHFVDRVCGSIEQKRNGVDVGNIKNLITNSKQIRKLEKSYVICDDNIQVSINPETGNLIQTNPRKRRNK